MISKSFASTRSLVKNTKSAACRLTKFLSTMTTAQTSPNQNGVGLGGPIRFSSRLKEGRALAQDVWSIYKSVHVACAPV